jgi:hypothetical protein
VLHERRELHVERRRHFADGGWSKKSAVRLHRAPSSSLSLIPPGSVAESLVWRRVAIDTGMGLPIHWPPKGHVSSERASCGTVRKGYCPCGFVVVRIAVDCLRFTRQTSRKKEF